jgi:hypothetical protein
VGSADQAAEDSGEVLTPGGNAGASRDGQPLVRNASERMSLARDSSRASTIKLRRRKRAPPLSPSSLLHPVSFDSAWKVPARRASVRLIVDTAWS